jgi:uncharacterized protein
MKWEGHEQSRNVEDRRGMGGGGGGRIGGRGIGLGTIVIALLAGWIFGINPMTVLVSSAVWTAAAHRPCSKAPRRRRRPMTRWPPSSPPCCATPKSCGARCSRAVRAAATRSPSWCCFRGAVPTACGTGQSAMGPFYCPGDAKVYIDLGFFETMKNRMGAPGDFAQAYVIAHEVGHHIQNLMGITQKVDGMRGRIPEVQMNALSVKVELQADCLAGVWAHHSQRGKQWLEQGDIEEALNAASQIGDDTLQRKSQGTVVPESFTHGSSAQRVAWFKRGLQSGTVNQCNTFDGR